MTPFPKPVCAGWVLAGGLSRRMGSPKALLEINGQPQVARTAQLVAGVCASSAIVGPPEDFARFGFPAFADEQPRLGPLGGILTALSRTQTDWNLVVACDLPYLTAEWLRYLVDRAAGSSARVILPHSAAGPEPMCAVYHRDAAAAIRAAIKQGRLKVTRALEGQPIESVTPPEIQPFDPRGNLFQNLNTPQDYDRARADLERS